MALVGVVADDLTGARDTGVQFRKSGMSTMVYPDASSIEGLRSLVEDNGHDVVVANTDTRNSAPDVAYARVGSVCSEFRAAEVGRMYKKMDSTLRGNIGRELDAAIDAWGARVACVAPAFPELGRGTVGGCQLLNGAPVDATEMAEDVLSPVRNAHLPTLLAAGSCRKVGQVALDIVRQGSDAVARRLHEAADQGFEVLVFDAETQRDLDDIAAGIVGAELAALMCGSAGLALGLLRALDLRKPNLAGSPRAAAHVPHVPRVSHAPSCGPTLVVSGSRSQTTQAQIEQLKSSLGAAHFSVGFAELKAAAEVADAFAPSDDAGLSTLLARMSQVLAAGRDVVISGSANLHRRDSVGTEVTAADDLIWAKQGMSDTIVLGLGGVVKRLLEFAHVCSIVLTGGDTAAAVCKQLKVPRLALIDEILPGMPVATVAGGPYDGLTMVTKAGAFGGDDALVHVLRYLKNRAEGDVD